MTINEIAKMAGVSNAAVSRYLNGGSLSQEKRTRIKAVIDETGYQPDTYAQMLRTRKVRQIGVIVPKISSTAVAEATAGISDVLNRENYMFLLANTDNNEKKELEYLNLFGANRAAGVILLATVITPEHEEMLSHMRIPVVLVGQRHRQFPCVYHNDYEAARELDELVLKKGRRRIGYIGVTQRDVAVGYLRRKALVDVCRDYGIEENQICFAEGDFSHGSGYEQARLLLEREPELDAIVCATDTAAVGVIQTARQMGRRVPEDLSVVGIGDSWACRVVEPALTTAHYFYEESGREAARMMLSLLEGKENFPVRQTMLGYELKLRDSL
ncbi:MAG: LacI family DNA-binding transcriptional regulator [Clostridiales bacterium]|nr:LacI family DNA-binding transcriptional regulator [Clostridiales bacterium]